MWLLFFKGLRSRWWELAAAVLVVGLVVAALIAQRAISNSAEKSVHSLAHRLGRNMLVVPAATDLASFYGHSFGEEALPDTAPATIRSFPLAEHVQAIEARLYGNAGVAGIPSLVVGQDLAWPSLPGRTPVVIGAELARRTGLSRGSSFDLGGAAFEVLDVTATPPDGLDTAAFMPVLAAQRALNRLNRPGIPGGSIAWEDGAMGRRSRYPAEVRERAVRLVFEQQGQHESQWAAVCSIAGKMGCTAETLRKWLRQAERDAGGRPGLTTSERERLKELERENRELKRANEILRKASAYFAQAELDRRPK